MFTVLMADKSHPITMFVSLNESYVFEKCLVFSFQVELDLDTSDLISVVE